MAQPLPLAPHQGPMVWIDCEMTGLDPKKNKILEIAVIITNGNLEMVDPGIEFIIKTDKKVLDAMDKWCTEQHGKSGLTQACLDSPYTSEEVAAKVLEYVKHWVPVQRCACLAGNSVHADRSFLQTEMPELVDWLHYRIIDVSSIKELFYRWYPQQWMPKIADSKHRALDDIRGSINELRWYREHLFVPPEKFPADGNSQG